MCEPFQPGYSHPDRFPRANLQPAAEPRSAGVICLLYTIRISLGILILLFLTSLLLISLASTKYIPFYWMKVGIAGMVISGCLIGVLTYWEQKLSQDSILERCNSAQQRIRSWASDGWRARRRRNRRPNPQDNPVPVQDESILAERRVGPLIVPQQMEDSQLPGTSVERSPRRPLTAAETLARSMVRVKPNPILSRARHDYRIPPESIMTRQLQQTLCALSSASDDVERSDPQTSDVQQPANQEQIPQIPGAVNEPEGSEDPVQGPAEGRCPLADLDDI